MLKYEDSRYACLFEYLTPLTRFLGLFTAVVLCGVGVDVAFHHHTMGLYLIVCALLVFFLEITWTINLFLQVCSREEGCTSCWRSILWFDGWKKSLFYSGIAAALIAWPHRLWLSTVSGGMLLVLAACYLVLWLSNTPPNPDARLLSHRDDSYDRFDAEVLDDSFSATDCPNSPEERNSGSHQREASALIIEI